MIGVKIVVNNECKDKMLWMMFSDPKGAGHLIDPFVKPIEEVRMFNIDSKGFIPKRDAQKIINDYAVTKLPFLVLVDDSLPEDKREYAALYSEEGPITIERINKKL